MTTRRILSRILSDSDLDAALAAPKFLLFKHSTVCPVSANAFEEYEAFVASHPKTPTAWLDVIAERPLARRAAEATGVQHESPQAIWLHAGKAAWHASHGAITEAALTKAVRG
ncbi:MAG: bacillithiol system redox-active protein YtxJ [Planctomycetes bacterium]|nr:bacillithiol system redox-active protein YtxJ [Planctomycetota bacterium]